MNILVIGNCSKAFYEKIKESTMLDKIYVACKEELIPLFKEMVEKYRIDKIPNGGIVAGGK